MAFLAAIPAVISSFAAATGAATAAAGAAATAATGLTGAQLLTVAATGLSALGAIQGGMANSAAAKYQSQVSAVNAMIANDNAKRATERSQEAQLEQDTLTMAQLGEQEAAQSATGLSGRSQMLTRKAAITLGRQDALKTIAAGEIDAYNFKNQSNAFAAESGAYKAKASNSMLSGFLSAGSSLISGASSINNPNRFNPYQRKGAA